MSWRGCGFADWSVFGSDTDTTEVYSSDIWRLLSLHQNWKLEEIVSIQLFLLVKLDTHVFLIILLLSPHQKINSELLFEHSLNGNCSTHYN